MLEVLKRAFRTRLPQFWYFVATKPTFSREFSWWTPKSATSKLTFHARHPSIFIIYMSQNATHATEFPRGHHLTQPWQCDPQKARNTIRPKCCAYQANCTWTSPKWCACREKWKSSSENDAKVLRLSKRTTFDTLWTILQCHKVPRLPNETKSFQTSNSDHFCKHSP